MPEEQRTDTHEAPQAEGSPGVEPQEPGSEVAPAGDDGVGEPEQPGGEPGEVDPIEQIERRLFDKFASWQGRREKDMMAAIGTYIENKIPKSAGQTAASVKDGEEEGPSIYDNQDAWLEDRLQRRSQKQAQFLQRSLTTAANAVLTDPQLEPYRKEIAEEIKAAAPRLKHNVPPEVAGELLAKDAIASFLKKRNLTPQNPLAGNRPTGAALGGVTGKTATTTAPSKVPKNLSPQAQKYMNYLITEKGYTSKDIEKVFS